MTTKPQLRAACYCRISSDPKDKREGVDRQREDTATMCEVQGWTPAGFYIDNDRSASNGKRRSEWERLLADVAAGKIDAIVVWNQDRGWRKMADLESLRPQLEPRGVLLATTNIGVVDVRNPDDVFRAQVSTAMSELEVAKMRVRQRRAARSKAEKGTPKWKRAFGYLPDTRDKKDDDGTRQLDPVTAPLVETAYKKLLTGAKLGDICKLLNDAGAYGLTGKPWTASTVSLFLRAPRNAGLRSHTHMENGKPVTDIVGKGTWPALVNERTWKAVQDKLNAPGRAPGKKSVRRHLLTGVMRCGNPGCEGYLAGNWVMQAHGAGPRAHSITYACKTCRAVSIRAEHVEPLLYKLVGGRLAKPDAEDLLKAAILDETDAEAIRAELAVLYADRTQIGVERGKRLLTGEQAKIATDLINEDIATLEGRQNDQEMLQVFEGIPLGTPAAHGAVLDLSPDRFRAVVNVLIAPVVKPVGKGGHVFDPDRLVPNWKRQALRS
jgi:DNA invertase Pin-like site-specific DNA recombinase